MTGAQDHARCRTFRPDLFRAVALLSVPFLPRLSISPSAWEQQKYPGKIFYQQIFRSLRRVAEEFFEADVRGLILNALYSASGEPPAGAALEIRGRPQGDGQRDATRR